MSKTSVAKTSRLKKRGGMVGGGTNKYERSLCQILQCYEIRVQIFLGNGWNVIEPTLPGVTNSNSLLYCCIKKRNLSM